MSSERELTLNEQYSVACKGYDKGSLCPFSGQQMYAREEEPWLCADDLPDYLTSDAELGRMVKALASGGGRELSIFRNASKGFTCDVVYYGDDGEQFVITGDEDSLNKAVTFVCIALGLRVPDGGE